MVKAKRSLAWFEPESRSASRASSDVVERKEKFTNKAACDVRANSRSLWMVAFFFCLVGALARVWMQARPPGKVGLASWAAWGAIIF